MDVLAAFLVALGDTAVLAGALEAVEGGATAMANMLWLDENVRERVNDWRYAEWGVERRAKLYTSETRVVVFGTRVRRVTTLLIRKPYFIHPATRV